jgi:hypothetical protein
LSQILYYKTQDYGKIYLYKTGRRHRKRALRPVIPP